MIYDEVNKMIEYLKRKKECALQQADMGIKSGDLSYRNYQQGKSRAYSDAIDQAIAVLNKVPCARAKECDHPYHLIQGYTCLGCGKILDK